MKIKSILSVVFSIIFLLFLQSCNNSEINNSNSTTSHVNLKLVDAPDDSYKEVWVDIIDVQYNRSDDNIGWTSFDGFPVEEGSTLVDLLTLTAGSSHILTDQEIESGMLSQVRLVLGSKNSIVFEGSDEMVPLKTPSAQQSGLKLHLDTELVAGYSYTFILDWDVQKSIVKAGNSGIYNLKPVIRVTAEANSGTILGRVADTKETTENPKPLEALVSVYDVSDTSFSNAIASTTSNDEGVFMLQGIPGGSYVLTIEKEDYDIAYSETVPVINGEDKDAGTLLLTKSTGSISGRVADDAETDTNKIPIEAATVTVYNKDDTSFTTVVASIETDVDGNFILSDLPIGEYWIKVAHSDYNDYEQDPNIDAAIVVERDVENTIGALLMTLSPS